MNTGDDPYDILSVSKEATVEEVRKAYRKLAMKHHPDKFIDPAERDKNSQIFSRIAAAYEILSDTRCRAEYDRQQEDDVDDRGRPPGFDGNAVYDVPPPARRDTNKPVNSAAHKTSATGGKTKKKHPMHFHDPYEVFKTAFEAEFGFPYPGADYDNIPEAEMKRQMKLKDANSRKPKLLTNGDAGNSPAPHQNTGSDETKKKGGFLGGVFGGGKKASVSSPSDETALIVHDRNKNKSIVSSSNTFGKTSNALVKKKTGSIVPRDNGGGDGDEYGPPPGGNNRPASMETREYKIEHPDGTIETIEETTITRPDGSTETMRRTDKPDSKTGNWKKPVQAGGGGGNNFKAIGNGPEKKMLTNGNEKKKLAIENDKTKVKSTTKKPVLAIEDAPKEKTGRRLLGWGGGKN